MVMITAGGHSIRRVYTGHGIAGDRCVHLAIRDGETCRTYGYPTVLYYKPRQIYITTPKLRRKQSRVVTTLQIPVMQQPGTRLPGFCQFNNGVRPAPLLPTPVIAVRLQIDAEGHFSPPYSVSCLDHRVIEVQLFEWFESLSGRGSCRRPSQLRFVLLQAVPKPKVVSIMRDTENDIEYVKDLINEHFARAREIDTSMKEFAVFITDPTWQSQAGIQDNLVIDIPHEASRSRRPAFIAPRNV
ncbi:hypothetical protein B0O99DRAFT_73132 [Bisporella sp. PMI_857]|nr:hypothetical protein B0O99DRAFT_73132 [Bisporella sp. PMI_857]